MPPAVPVLLADVPWYYAGLIAPICVSIVSTLLTILVTYLGIRLTAFYRTLSRWEPYSEFLWKARIELYWRVIEQTRQTFTASYNLAYTRDGGDEFKRLHEVWETVRGELVALESQAVVILDSDFNACLRSFLRETIMFAGPGCTLEYKQEHEDSARGFLFSIMDYPRKSLGIDKLDEKAKAEILGGEKPPAAE